ncbi:MAG TPA: hypothetical protein VHF89_03140 [Solirubrobacteraceae bacterium]|nr:hypothetical protein [Solirubrobacteraceae bacterium]
MATVQEPAPRAGTRADAVTLVLLLVGAIQVATGILALAGPGAFYDAIAGYPPQNDHFVMDLGSWQIALGAITLYGARRADWRLPLLGFLALQYVLHTIPHALHAGDSDPEWHGVFGLVAQALGALLLAGLFLRERAR